MAHYCFIDENNVVVSVIVGKDEDELGNDGVAYDWEEFYGREKGLKCLRTSYNTRGGEHAFGGTPYRKNYAGIGFSYDEALDAFVPPKPFESWLLNEETCLWEAPVPMPEEGLHTWNEETQSWEPVQIGEE